MVENNPNDMVKHQVIAALKELLVLEERRLTLLRTLIQALESILTQEQRLSTTESDLLPESSMDTPKTPRREATAPEAQVMSSLGSPEHAPQSVTQFPSEGQRYLQETTGGMEAGMGRGMGSGQGLVPPPAPAPSVTSPPSDTSKRSSSPFTLTLNEMIAFQRLFGSGERVNQVLHWLSEAQSARDALVRFHQLSKQYGWTPDQEEVRVLYEWLSVRWGELPDLDEILTG